MRTFAGIDKKYSQYESAEILLQSIPYNGTSTWGKGADKGFEAFLRAAENMELYDIETDSEVYRKGIHILPEIKGFDDPQDMVNTVYAQTEKLLDNNKLLTFFGGEHSISIGIIKAFQKRYPDITVVQLDAHADFRSSYLGSPYNHACALHEASKQGKLIQVGIRSMDISEKEYLDPDTCYFAKDISGRGDWMTDAIDKMSDKVYITVDLDVFDPSIMPSTGTPEPGGLGWYEVLEFLKGIYSQKQVMGFDIVELAPIEGQPAPDFLAAKLYYKMLSYHFNKGENNDK